MTTPDAQAAEAGTRERRRLRQAFDAAMAHFSLPPEVRRIAWEQAKRSPAQAYSCYSAIERSL